MPKYEVSLLRTEVVRYKFTITAKDEVTAEKHANNLVEDLDDGRKSIQTKWEEELESVEWEVEELNEE